MKKYISKLLLIIILPILIMLNFFNLTSCTLNEQMVDILSYTNQISPIDKQELTNDDAIAKYIENEKYSTIFANDIYSTFANYVASDLNSAYQFKKIAVYVSNIDSFYLNVDSSIGFFIFDFTISLDIDYFWNINQTTREVLIKGKYKFQNFYFEFSNNNGDLKMNCNLLSDNMAKYSMWRLDSWEETKIIENGKSSYLTVKGIFDRYPQIQTDYAFRVFRVLNMLDYDPDNNNVALKFYSHYFSNITIK